MILSFGKFQGRDLSDPTIPVSYIKWLSFRGAYYKLSNRFETDWKVPIDVSIEARREMERRGFRRVDDDYELNEK